VAAADWKSMRARMSGGLDDRSTATAIGGGGALARYGVGLLAKPSRRHRRRATHRRPSCLAGFDPDGVSAMLGDGRGVAT